MAGLPQDRPVPGAPLLDPLGTGAPPILPVAPAPPPAVPVAPQLPDVDPLSGLPAAPAPEQGYQFDGVEPVPLPMDEWFPGQPGLPAGYQGHDVPEVPNDQAAPAAQPAAAQAGGQGRAALDQARQEGHIIDPYAADQAAPAKRAQPAARQGTGDAYLDAVARADAMRSGANAEETRAGQEKNDYLRAQGMQMAQDRADAQAHADREYKQVYDEARARRAELDNEAKAIAGEKIDPKRRWNNMSFGAQLFTAVTAGLTGATTRAVQTGQNPVLDQMEKMTQLDIEAQKADLDNRWKGNTVRRGLVADDLAAGRDMLDVSYKSLNAMYESAKDYANAYAMKFDNPRLDAENQKFQADIVERQATIGMQYEQAKQKQIYDHRQQAFQNGMELRKQKFAETNAEANRENALELAGMRGQGKVSAQEAALEKRRESAILDPSGDPIDTRKGDVAHASSPEKAIEEREKMNLKWNYWKAIEKYRKDLEDSGREFGGAAGIIGQSNRMSRLRSEHAAIIPAYLRMHGIERLTGVDEKLVGESVIPPPESWTHSTNPLPAVDAAKDAFRREMNNEMQTVWGVHDKDWVGTYETAHPETFTPGATEGAGNSQGKAQEPVTYDEKGHPNRLRQAPPTAVPVRPPATPDELDALPIGGSMQSDVPLDNRQRLPPVNFGLE